MAGPAIDQKAAAEMEKGAVKPGYSDAVDLAGRIAKHFSEAKQAKDSGLVESVPDKSLLSYENAPHNAHMLQMEQAAEEARQKYMKENGVDENGDPLP